MDCVGGRCAVWWVGVGVQCGGVGGRCAVWWVGVGVRYGGVGV